jgi:hypothetical protein
MGLAAIDRSVLMVVYVVQVVAAKAWVHLVRDRIGG